MPLSLADLLTAKTRDDLLAALLADLATLGFPTTSWHGGSVPRTLLELDAATLADLHAAVVTVARGGFLDDAERAWLTLLVESWFQLDRDPARFAQGTVRLTAAAGAGPYTIAVGQLWLVSASGHRFTNTTGGTLPLGGTLDITVQAENPGAAHNVPNDTITVMVTPLPGVTATNPAVGTTGTWLTTPGADEESDVALRARARRRWATIGLEKTADAYAFLATSTPDLATPVTRVYVDDTNPRGAGTLDVWLAGAAGPLPTADRDAVRAYLLARKSGTADVLVDNAAQVSLTVTATLHYRASAPDTVAAAQANVEALVRALPLGGTLYRADVVEALMTPPGAVNAPLGSVLINGGTADVALAVSQVGVLTSLVITGVAA